MATYTQVLYHLVYGTKNHRGTLDLEQHDEVCRYIVGILRNKNCFVYKVGGYIDHLHILTSLHSSLALANVIKDIKLATSDWIKKEKKLSIFDGWQDGYGAFTCSWKDKERVINYIANQHEHHRHKTFREEYIEMLKRSGVEFDEKYLC
ncbi:MAG: transposase [Phycisphaerae bacterium]|nr:transposase [Phycisphaerae bacterium]